MSPSGTTPINTPSGSRKSRSEDPVRRCWDPEPLIGRYQAMRSPTQRREWLAGTPVPRSLHPRSRGVPRRGAGAHLARGARGGVPGALGSIGPFPRLGGAPLAGRRPSGCDESRGHDPHPFGEGRDGAGASRALPEAALLARVWPPSSSRRRRVEEDECSQPSTAWSA